jgi:hypothetical protein
MISSKLFFGYVTSFGSETLLSILLTSLTEGAEDVPPFLSDKHWEAVEGIPGLQGLHWIHCSCEKCLSYPSLVNALGKVCRFSLGPLWLQDDAKKADKGPRNRYTV